MSKILIIVILIIILLFYGYDKNETPIINSKAPIQEIKPVRTSSKEITYKKNEKFIYENISFDQKRNYFGLCLTYSIRNEDGQKDYFVINPEESLRNFVQSHQDYELKDSQLRAIANVFKHCKDFIGFEIELVDEVSNNPYIDSNGIGLLEKELKKTVQNEGIEEAFKLMENNLLSNAFQNRSNAKSFARNNSEWLKDVNDLLELNLLDKESFDYFQKALMILECDLNIVDCSPNSLTMLNYCNVVQEACGQDARDFIRSMISSFEMFYIDKYMNYLLSLQRNQLN